MPDNRISRLPSTSSLTSSTDSYAPNGYLSTERVRSGSEDTLSAFPNKGKNKAINRLSADSETMSQRLPSVQVEDDEGDVGDFRDRQRERERKGKMRADRQKPWDEEQGRAEQIYGQTGVYPPTNEEEEEEKRIQEVGH